MNEIGIPIEKTFSVEWMLAPLFLLLLSYAVIRHMKVGIVGDSIRQYFSFSLANKHNKGSSGLSGRLSVALIINSFVAISIFVYKVLSAELIFVNPYLLYGIILGGALVLFGVKTGVVSLVKGITESGDVLEKAKGYNLKYYEIIGVLLLPGIIAMLFFSQSMNVDIDVFGVKDQNIGLIYCLFIFAILYVFKLFQSIRQSLDVKISWYYIILYLCTLEILPLVVIYRLLVGKI